MSVNFMSVNLETARQYWEDLNFDDICTSMCSTSYPLPRWSRPQAELCLLLYKRFLWLMVKYPQHKLVPTREIDECWHNHILNTQRYTQDCLQLAGYYLHHEPSYPDNLDQQKLAQQFTLTCNLYRQEFGEELLVLLEHE
ncbi:MAG: hypothetical protein KIT27_09375 [Legionellales bacterium]|nr:hypothetical protein [Legionellales bacterium]